MFKVAVDPFSFFVGFTAASVFWLLISRARPLWNEMRAGIKEQREISLARKTNAVEENHRRITLRRAQGMHLAAPLFALDEIIQEPLLIAPRGSLSLVSRQNLKILFHKRFPTCLAGPKSPLRIMRKQ